MLCRYLLLSKNPLELNDMYLMGCGIHQGTISL